MMRKKVIHLWTIIQIAMEYKKIKYSESFKCQTSGTCVSYRYDRKRFHIDGMKMAEVLPDA